MKTRGGKTGGGVVSDTPIGVVTDAEAVGGRNDASKPRGGGSKPRGGGRKPRGGGSKPRGGGRTGGSKPRGGAQIGANKVLGGGKKARGEATVSLDSRNGVTQGESSRGKVKQKRRVSQRDCDFEDITEERAAKARAMEAEAEEVVNDNGDENVDMINAPVNEQEQEVVESEADSVDGDDCEVIVEDTVGYKEVEPELAEDEEDSDAAAEQEEATEQEEPHEEMVDVQICENLEQHFGNVATEAQGNDDDSGDDAWDDDNIPDPLSDDEVENEGRPTPVVRADEILGLGKFYNNADEFKHALLRYSLKSQYDIRMYKSSSDRNGAKCTQEKEENCPWRVYCSFEKAKNKLIWL